jgi:squalene-hopene/tetraprenyl-beta-curcumene cyclase
MFTETSSNSSSNSEFNGSCYKPSTLNKAIALAKKNLLSLQSEDGYWVFELEADCTIPAEYILMMHFMDEVAAPLQTKICNFCVPNKLLMAVIRFIPAERAT